MNWFRTICLVAIAFAAAGTYAQNSAASHDPHEGRSPGTRLSFLEFAMKRINPQGKDYGQCLEDVRRTAIESTIKDYCYWSHLIAVVGLLMTFSALFRQRRLLRGRELSTARILCWYHNELFAARDHAFDLASKYTELRSAVEPQLETLLPRSGKTESPLQQCSASSSQPIPTAESPNEQTLRDTIKKMEEQASCDKQTLNSLRQQVTVLTRRLQEEQHKNHRQARTMVSAAGKQKDGNEREEI